MQSIWFSEENWLGSLQVEGSRQEAVGRESYSELFCLDSKVQNGLWMALEWL